MAKNTRSPTTSIKIRNLPAEVVVLLSDSATKAGISREEYCRRLLTTFAIKPEILNLDQKYETLVSTVLTAISKNTEILTSFLEQTKGGDSL